MKARDKRERNQRRNWSKCLMSQMREDYDIFLLFVIWTVCGVADDEQRERKKKKKSIKICHVFWRLPSLSLPF